ncbi:MAG: Ig-like domain-containing protein [Nitrosomonadales bacterium]|nr:Ig-like domain-containing protein [Nitrosomonadales bacterium]
MNKLSLAMIVCSIAMVLVACTDGSTSNSSVASDIPDYWAPTVLSTTPANGAIVPGNSAITATFSEAVDPATVNTSTFLVAGIMGTVTYSGTTATFTPSTPLASGTTYAVTITTGVRDFANNSMGSNYSSTFTTAPPDLIPPAVSSTSPIDAASAVATNAAINATFSEALDPATVTSATFTLLNGTTPVAGTVTYTSTTATFTPSTLLAGGTLYTATITTGTKDLANNAISSSYTWSFTTAVPDLTPPTILSTSPAGAALSVSFNTAVSATFSEAMNPATVSAANFTLMNGATPVSGSVTYSGTTATFTPSVPLVHSTLYTAMVSTGIKDLAGNAMSTNCSWTFTTFTLTPSPPPPLNQSVAYQNDYAHSGYVTLGAPITFPATPTWSVTLNGAVSYPLIAGGKVFVTTAGLGAGYGTELYALDKLTGVVAWGPVAIPGTYLWSGLAYDHGKVFVVNFNGLLKSFDAATGQAGWSIQLPAYWIDAPPTAVNGIVYVGAQSYGRLYAIDESNGNILWTAQVAGGGKSSPSVSSDGVFVTYPCQAYKFNPFSGATLWHYLGGCSGGGGRTSPYANGLLYMRDSSNPTGLIFDAATGTQTGTFNTDLWTPIPAFSAQAGFFQSAGTLQAIDLVTHNVLWSFTGDGLLVSAPIVIDQVVVVGSSSGNVYAVNAVTGVQIWSGTAGAAIAAPDEHNVSQPLTGFGAGEGYLVVPAGNVLSAWHISGP